MYGILYMLFILRITYIFFRLKDIERKRNYIRNQNMKKNLRSLIITLSVFSMMTVSAYCFPDFQKSMPLMAEQTVDDLENLKNENANKLKELQNEIETAKQKISDVAENENSIMEIQKILDEKIDLQNQNIYLVNNQLIKLNESIQNNELQIKNFEDQLFKCSIDLEQNKELLKKRIRTSYISGNDSMFSIFTGSADFYDILAKYELVARISEHDATLISNIQEEVEKIESLKTALSSKKQELEMNRSDSDQKKTELENALAELAANYENNESDLYSLSCEREGLEGEVEDKEKALSEQEAELKKISSDIEELQNRIREESIAESIKYSESVSVSESIAAEEAKKAEEKRRSEEAKKKAEQTVRNTEAPATEAPVAEPEPVVPATEAPAYTVNSSGFIWPVPGFGMITSGYGPRSLDNHKGVDITSGGSGSIMGKQIVAVADGIVASVNNSCTHNYGKSGSCGCGGGYGNYVVILHSDGTYATLYGHMSSVVVQAGQRVSQGQTIGYGGTTGWSTGPHLHFEVHKIPFSYDRSNTLDPQDFIGSSAY